MKNPLVQLILSGAVLGLMGGAAAIHALHISGAQELSEHGDLAGHGAQVVPSGNPILPIELSSSQPQVVSAGVTAEKAATLQALEEIVDRLQELKVENQVLQGENRNLQDQLEETNRDLSELQFRVDSHSESFRPLKFTSDAGSGSLLAPLRQSIGSENSVLHPLLPPKE